GEKVNRCMGGNETAEAQSIIRAVGIGIAVLVVMVITTRQRDVPTVIVAIGPNRIGRAVVLIHAAVLGGHRAVVLSILGMGRDDAASQSQGNQQTQALTFHLLSLLSCDH